MKLIKMNHDLHYKNGEFKDADYYFEFDKFTCRLGGVTKVSDEKLLMEILNSKLPFTFDVEETQMFVCEVILKTTTTNQSVTLTCHIVIYGQEE